MLKFRVIEHGSNAYHEMVSLRDIVLRKPLGLSFTADYLQKEINDQLIGCYKEESLVACCILTRLDDSTVQLRQMAVDNTQQGQGIGRQLILFAEQQSKNKGYTRLMMHARKVAKGFYEKLGYSAQGPEFEEVGIPHNEMSKEL
ncbi:Acetyltransferase (GNAT) domain-containing protein [Chitinophaga sp. CF118]|uniref:GNAT family N-acetyltransferase n=1 Tax=Chitinophaga sp. CF118 TaxID=1884367 RepID=UPI0008E6EEA8|nr:GNAT family N-acetyltransferase [Chitinophaga sp. CF118]SFD27556.1 Acetyltransferase (GNAT) domain-containing protein [Chitinophaga sp. CF118]